MTTNSYLEYFLTLLGWLINNGLWDVLLGTGLFALPLVFKVIGIWLRVREEGEDEGNKGLLSLPRIEHALYMGFFVIISCCWLMSVWGLLSMTAVVQSSAEHGRRRHRIRPGMQV